MADHCDTSIEVTPAGLYPRVLGDSWSQLAEPVRLAHTTGSMLQARGRLRVVRGPGRVARGVVALLRLPHASGAADTRLIVTPEGTGERWRRIFDGRPLVTEQRATGARELGERHGIFECRFRLDTEDGSLIYRQTGAAIVLGSIRIRLPKAIAPRVEGREDPASGPHQVDIHIRVALPLVGTLLTYDGTMTFEEPRA